MNRIDLVFNIFYIQMACVVLMGIFSIFYHKWKRIDAYQVIETTEQIILTKNPATILFSTIEYFFRLSLFSFIAATNQYNLVLQLLIIYVLCFLLAMWYFIKKRNYRAIFEKSTKQLLFKSHTWSLIDNKLVVRENRIWLCDEFDLYGLYLKDQRNQYVLIYGYAGLKDIEQLKTKIAEKLPFP